MSSVDISGESTPEPTPDELVEVARYPSASAAFERGLVVLAQGSPCWLDDSPEGVRLLVERGVSEGAREQVARFERERVQWPPRVLGIGPRKAFYPLGPLWWVLAVTAAFALQEKHPGWTDAGLLDAHAVFEKGEVWRAFTALFLHADAAHLCANAVSGFGVFTAVLSTFGRRWGAATLFASAVLGNLAAAAIHFSSDYRSLGASTAVFAGIGLLTGHAAVGSLRSAASRRWQPLFAPLATGVVVLALYGAGGVQVDVLAHATGFLAGVLFGAGVAHSARADDAPPNGRGLG